MKKLLVSFICLVLLLLGLGGWSDIRVFAQDTANRIGANSSGNSIGANQTDGNRIGANESCPTNTLVENLLPSICSIKQLIYKLVDLVYQIGLPLVALAIIWTGFLYVTARGNQAQIQRAHTAFLWTVVGAAIVLGARVIVEIIEGTVTNLGK